MHELIINVSNTAQAAIAADASEDLFDTAGTESSLLPLGRCTGDWLLNHCQVIHNPAHTNNLKVFQQPSVTAAQNFQPGSTPSVQTEHSTEHASKEHTKHRAHVPFTFT